MGTNYYVNTPSCPNACEHCAESERIHLGKSSAGLRFIFRAEPEWPRDEAFAHWVRRALSGPIADEYGKPITLAELLDLAASKADDLHTACRHDFISCGHDFCDRPFSQDLQPSFSSMRTSPLRAFCSDTGFFPECSTSTW